MRSGYVIITGKPNVGKSTLLNTIVTKKVAITSPKPQTTRNQIKVIYKKNDLQILFIDTPGWHQPKFKLDLFLNSEIRNSYKIADIVLLLIDLTRDITDEDQQVISIIKTYGIQNVILVLTKIDLSSAKKNASYTDLIKKYIDVADVVGISSKKNIGINKLLATIAERLNNNVNQPLNHHDNDNFTISEIIREQVIFNTRQELPYATTVYVELNQYDHFTNTLDIQAIIVVEKASQKPILIGHNGTMIKKIGITARKELMKIYDCKINLKLFVKVEKEWRNNEKFLASVGYGK
ncbi:MAG: GTPase Era [Mycoplasmataceae bacterium]|jgi:GTP-binding protein Era|nr:GTPase Era [Mycoplasmataceae bacterium]